ncbi:hypothetical protein AK812_SmicGene34880 [Symbiodinium microadriaticum]|uniref:EF-hand domain-containing protein n=1 Tax=Symbiodinium microadriaticum TaxID=2951 RepID=A0A1Q9CMZ3_SYMMI|nr:hypothetical protein AK812_SmicGene34880 [Symbiodinium microadriaticum]
MAAGIFSWDFFSTCTRETTDELRKELSELRSLIAALQEDRQEVRRLTEALLRSITTSTWSDGRTPTPDLSPRSIHEMFAATVVTVTRIAKAIMIVTLLDVTQHHSSGSTEPGCQRGLGMDSTCISCFVILLIVGSMVLLALEADSCARYGLHDLPDFFVWANLVVFLLFALEMGFRLRLCRCPCPDVLCYCCRPLGFIASCACECQARFTALASRIAKKSPDVLLVLDLLVVGMQGVDVGVSMAARLAAGSELHATAYLRIAQYLRWFRIVRCLRFIPAFASMKVQMDLIKGAVVPLLSAVFVLFFSISTVATLVTAVVADACRQQPDVGSCGEHFESLWESMYNVFMGTFGGLDFDDLVRPIRSVSPLACIIISVYMTLIYLMMMTVLTAHLCQKAVETASADQVEGRLKRLFQEILLLGEITDGRNQISLDRFTEDEDDGCDAEWVMQTMGDRDADADDHDDGEEVDEPMVLLCSMVKSPVELIGFELCGFFLPQRIKELFEQLDISTEEVRNRAHKLFKLIDENQNKHVEEREFVRGIMRLRSPAKNLKLWEVQLGS